MSKKIGIVGGGISGLSACKYLVEKGFNPVVLEAKGGIGGIWASQAIESTRLQTPKSHYQFSDFPWPASIQEDFPHHEQVLEYLNSYALHFNLFPFIKFHSRAVSIDYKNTNSCAPEPREFWGDNGEPFSCTSKWIVLVEDTRENSVTPKMEAYQFDFVILCIGKYSDVAHVPEFPEWGGPEVFHGKVLHSLDYAAMGSDRADELTRCKRITVVGFQKSAVDLSVEIASKNGVEHPCTLVYKKVHWMVPEELHSKNFKFLNRFAELMVPKPAQGYLSWLLTFIFSPWLWIFSKLMEVYLKWAYPLKKYGIVPKHGFLTQITSCMFTIMPRDFFRRVEEGSLLLKHSSSNLRFCEEGLLVNGTVHPSDIVIFATGYKSEEKLANIFLSPTFRDLIFNSSSPFYRECIHPRIPQLAILGYSDSPSILYTTEMRSKWVASLIAGKFKLPTIRQMEEESLRWKNCAQRYVGKANYKRSCVSVSLQIHCNDGICKDMGANPRRKKWFLQDLFTPYGPTDYANLD